MISLNKVICKNWGIALKIRDRILHPGNWKNYCLPLGEHIVMQLASEKPPIVGFSPFCDNFVKFRSNFQINLNPMILNPFFRTYPNPLLKLLLFGVGTANTFHMSHGKKHKTPSHRKNGFHFWARKNSYYIERNVVI